MSEKIPRLPDEHLGRAREIVAEKRTKQKCKVCYDRGYIGTNQDNMLVPCSKCVDVEGVMEGWRAYVAETPALKELYGDYFEDEEEEEGTDEGEDKGEGEGEGESEDEGESEKSDKG
ncbi:MAG: hypothetical protein HOI20_17415 [Gemmatimonadetes bacterium]|jgi:hypothetical protein|nr:hypothetical protein [Gemmatimonadota bacterium]MBT5803371.1 hypothetical protein [Gemmatimonadota bacterium]MBT6906017.1 hypothetical protein [Gemmatimonadota bacterium]MBT7417506.1 hypothetical protein [Gemmatimonadota bacterium]MBT7589294.1 hypothetical protein [Gemmatimonadota bacterium]|tara:strand:+ start:2713 stop:3063 length:351 start_codon:yes stop_codon:yes gene_type:complete